MTSSTETFQVSIAQAEAYEARFVPSLFGEWAPYLVDAVGIGPGRAVLDVACGTGVVTREAADRMKNRGEVIGLDLNEGMLAVASRLRSDIEWRQGDACDLPFPDASFDAVLCQASLMFFSDRARALREMARVARPDGVVGIQVWSSLEAQPGYGPLIEVAAHHAGPEAIDLLGSYWVLGDLDLVAELLQAAGLEVTQTLTRMGIARFDSIDELVKTEVESTPLIERIDAEVYEGILADARAVLERFQDQDGKLKLPIEGHVITAHERRPQPTA